MKNLFGLFLFFCLFFKATLFCAEKPLVVIVCSYNNQEWVTKNLDSLFCQKYTNYRIIYIDDCSTDATEKTIRKYMKKHPLKKNFQYIRTQYRRYKLANLYWAVHELCDDHEIVVEVDGDDWLLTASVFTMLNEIYQDGSVWMTYGGFKTWPSTYHYLHAHSVPTKIVADNCFRQFHQTGYIFIALRSFYAGLFKQIKKEDLQQDGRFFTTASDIATMIPMFEIAGQHFHHITQTVYLYNTGTPLNDFKRDCNGQKTISKLMLNKPPYQPLSDVQMKALLALSLDL